MAIQAFYRGMAYPFQESDEALPAPAYDDLLIKYSLQQILGTNRGERVMRPAFGCNLYQFVFENNNELLEQLLRAEIAAAVARWEPRAYLQGIEVLREENEVTVTISYSVITTGRVDTLSMSIETPYL